MKIYYNREHIMSQQNIVPRVIEHYDDIADQFAAIFDQNKGGNYERIHT